MHKFAGICALVAALFLAVPVQGGLVNLALSEVGDVGNSPDTTGHGAVSYDFWMGTFEVSIGQYTTFLNSVATLNTNLYLVDLWNPQMGTDVQVRGISRSGTGIGSDPYVYEAIGDPDRPVSYVSWFDAARFANWVNNGAMSGSGTETGAYNLNGAVTGVFTKESEAVWWIPSEDEWYNAGGALDADYWLYPTQSDAVPGNTIGAAPNQANYFNGSYSIPTAGNKLTDRGAFSGSAGTYGTFDMAGNLTEWNDSANMSGERGLRGGSYNDGEGVLRSSFAGSLNPAVDAFNVGFRLASAVPEPSTVILTTTGLLVCLLRRTQADRQA